MVDKIERPKAILFDLDDTISSYNSVCDPAWRQCCEELVQTHNTVFNSDELLGSINHVKSWYWSDPVREKKGRENLKEARREVVRFSLEDLGVSIEAMAFELADNYTELQSSMMSLLPGSREALDMIKEMGIRMAVITNGASAVQREKLNRFGVTQYFEKVIIDTEVGYSKPDKEIFECALNQLDLKPVDVWMVGDNLTWDIWGSQQLGIYAVWNDYSGAGLPDNPKAIPDRIVNSIYEMANFIHDKI